MVEIDVIETSNFKLDGGAMFGIVPRVLWADHHPPDERNRIDLAARVLLIRNDDRRILVDTGLGNCHEPRFIDIYGIEKPNFDFDEALGHLDETCETITDVILTHLHFDHAGGLVKQGPAGLEPAFSKAKIHVQRRQWEWALDPSRKDRASFLDGYLDVLQDNPNLNLIEGQDDITPHVRVVPVDGHTPAMQVVLIETSERTAFFPSDLVPTATHVHLPYIMAYDNQPVATVQEKERFLRQAAHENWLIYFQHDVGQSTGRIIEKEDKFQCDGD